MNLKICFVSSEVAPLAKTGGLADVAGALPQRLHALGHDVRVFMPLYSSVERSLLAFSAVPNVQNIDLKLGALDYRFSLVAGTLPDSQAPIYLIDCPAVFHRASLYTNDHDEHLRFLILQRAVLEACQRLKFAPDILHCNDWHVALLPLLIKTQYAWDSLFARCRSLLSIHNIGYQGQFASSTLGHMDLGAEIARLDHDDLATGRINWLKEGIRHADRVATVSPTYAQEICAPLGGHGLDTTLRARGDRIVGILNGVDYDEWNPSIDKHIPHRFSREDLSGKARNKLALLAQLGVQVAAHTPLIGIVSRLTPQKGFDLLFDSLPEILQQREFALAIVGSGEARYEAFFKQLARDFPERVAFHNGYSEALAHWIEAGSDMFLMPSMYEPCGLNQMYSLKYGTVPIVRRTGGLADSVQMWDAGSRIGTGIVFNDFDEPAVHWAIHTALDLFKDRAAWQQLMLNGMSQDYSWEHQVGEYVALYREMLSPSPLKNRPVT
ncbi:MAG: glycogen synthase [Candidatus Obscuribacterales bacterium]|nr:glycogen synthase [Steroidobacteraceae bacterium]